MNIFTTLNKKFPSKFVQRISILNLKQLMLFIATVFLYFVQVQIANSQNNVGIGCTNPDASAMLELRSTSMGFLAPRMTLAQRPATPALGLMIYQTDNTPGFYYYNGASWVMLLSGSFWSLTGNASTNPANNYVGTSDAQDLAFRTNNAERMRILSGGNLGINTNSPTQVLELANGNVLLSNTGTADQLRFAMPGGTNYTSFAAQTQAGNINYLLPAAGGTNGQVLTTNATGTLSWTTVSGSAGWTVGAGVVYNTTDNIGIGTSTPGQKLELSNGNLLLSNTGTASQLRFQVPGGGNYTALQAQAQAGNVTYTLPAADGSNGQVLGTNGAGTLSWTTVSGGSAGWTVGAGVVYNTTDNIGIGTSTPGQKLELSNGNLLLSNTGTASQLRFQVPGGGNYTALKAQAQAGNVTYTLPAGDGSIGQVLTTNGSGTLSWTAPSGSVPSGTSGQTLRYDATNTLVATSYLTNIGTQVAVNDNNSSSQAAPFLIIQNGTGDASQRYFLSGGQSVTTGINNGDNKNYEISNAATLSSTGNYTDANKMMRIHTETGSIGIVDLNHQSRARAYLSAVSSISTGVWTTIPYDTKNYDSQSEFNTGTYTFTATKDGYYQVNARTEFDISGTPGNGSYLTIGIYINGTLYSQGNNLQVAEQGGNGYLFYNNAPVVSDVVPLTAGQTITIRVFQNTGSSYNIKSGTATSYVSIHKVS
jgi:hypothetical protein